MALTLSIELPDGAVESLTVPAQGPVRIGRDLEDVLERTDEEAGEDRGWHGWLRRIPGLDRLR